MHQINEKFRLKKTVTVKMNEHANLDSFSLRYGFVFDKNTDLEISCDPSTLRLDKDPKKKDRYNILGTFTNPKTNVTETGIFYLINNQSNKFFDNDKVVTVIRYYEDEDTEHHLSEVIRLLRVSQDITCDELIKYHPLFINRQLRTHADLIRLLVKSKSESDVLRIQEVANNVVKKNQIKVDKLVSKLKTLENKNLKLKKELDEFNAQDSLAKQDGKVQNLEEPELLVKVRRDIAIGKSLCTVLFMENGNKRTIKISSFDKDYKVTEKAESLVGKKVRVSCWDPVNQPGLWSKKGYFRYIYDVEDKDVI
jgi:hypothetical protein